MQKGTHCCSGALLLAPVGLTRWRGRRSVLIPTPELSTSNTRFAHHLFVPTTFVEPGWVIPQTRHSSNTSH